MQSIALEFHLPISARKEVVRSRVLIAYHVRKKGNIDYRQLFESIAPKVPSLSSFRCVNSKRTTALPEQLLLMNIPEMERREWRAKLGAAGAGTEREIFRDWQTETVQTTTPPYIDTLDDHLGAGLTPSNSRHEFTRFAVILRENEIARAAACHAIESTFTRAQLDMNVLKDSFWFVVARNAMIRLCRPHWTCADNWTRCMLRYHRNS